MRAGRSPLLLAHRGDHRVAPENTIEAFRAALTVPGCGGVELDVRTSRDGEAVVVHDATLDRVQRRMDRVADLTADELAAFDVPRLADVFAALPSDAFVDVELKEAVVGPALAAITAARGSAGAHTAISSFSAEIVREALARERRWTVWFISADADSIAEAAKLGASGLALEWHGITRAAVREARRRRLHLIAWTTRDEPALDLMRRLGVDAVCAEGAALPPASRSSAAPE